MNQSPRSPGTKRLSHLAELVHRVYSTLSPDLDEKVRIRPEASTKKWHQSGTRKKKEGFDDAVKPLCLPMVGPE